MNRRMMRLQVAANLHLERYAKTPFPPILKPDAPTLLLAGNIARPNRRIYRDFLNYCARSWDHVMIVAGPCELAVATVEQCASRMREFPNVHFLNKTRIDREGVAFLGATGCDQDNIWLKKALAACDTTAIVLTHYQPLFGLFPGDISVSGNTPRGILNVPVIRQDFRDPELVRAAYGNTTAHELASQMNAEEPQNWGSVQMR